MPTLLTKRAAVQQPTARGISCLVCVVPATALARWRWKLEESLRIEYICDCNKHGSPSLRSAPFLIRAGKRTRNGRKHSSPSREHG